MAASFDICLYRFLRSQNLNILVDFAADFVIYVYLLIGLSPSFLKPKGFFSLLLIE